MSGDQIRSRFYYHGTTPEASRAIQRCGFRIGTIQLPGEDEPRFMGYGNIGFGTYISADWRIAAWFGSTLVRIRLAPGTRVLETPPAPDAKLLSSLKRRFGHDILRCRSPDRALPANKHLSLREHLALLGYHYRLVDRYIWSVRDLGEKRYARKYLHVKAMHALGAGLRRYGIHGFGDARGYNGLVVFESGRLLFDGRISIDRDLWTRITDTYDCEKMLLADPQELGIDPVDLAPSRA